MTKKAATNRRRKLTPKAATGRRSKLTPELQEKIVRVIRAGNYAYIAAEYAGIGQSTFYRWLEQGEAQTTGPYRDFREAVKAAEREAEIRAVATVQQHMGKSWQAAMTYLERKFPQRWGRRLDVTTDGNPITRVEFVIVDPETGEEEPCRQHR
jgi:transposase-like protein